MEWEKSAVEYFDNNVVAGPPQIELRKIYTEKIARQRKKDKVTQEDVEKCIKDYDEFFGEAFTQRLCDCMAKGEMPEVPPTQKEDTPCLYQVETCHSKYFGCPSQIIDVKELVYPVIDKMEESKITEILADKAHGPLLSHNKLTVSISSCANVCTGGESKDIGIWGVEKPKVNDDIECIDCKKCMHVCWDAAVAFENAKKPSINEVLCKLCGACIKACPTGTISSEKKGYRIFVGGTFGRMHTVGKEIFRMGEKEDVFKTLDAVIEMIRENQENEHFLAHVLQKSGIEYITSRVFK